MSWWKTDASEEGQQRLRTVAYYRPSAEIGQENSVEIQQDNVRAFRTLFVKPGSREL